MTKVRITHEEPVKVSGIDGQAQVIGAYVFNNRSLNIYLEKPDGEKLEIGMNAVDARDFIFAILKELL